MACVFKGQRWWRKSSPRADLLGLERTRGELRQEDKEQEEVRFSSCRKTCICGRRGLVAPRRSHPQTDPQTEWRCSQLGPDCWSAVPSYPEHKLSCWKITKVGQAPTISPSYGIGNRLGVGGAVRGRNQTACSVMGSRTHGASSGRGEAFGQGKPCCGSLSPHMVRRRLGKR